MATHCCRFSCIDQENLVTYILHYGYASEGNSASVISMYWHWSWHVMFVFLQFIYRKWMGLLLYHESIKAHLYHLTRNLHLLNEHSTWKMSHLISLRLWVFVLFASCIRVTLHPVLRISFWAIDLLDFFFSISLLGRWFWFGLAECWKSIRVAWGYRREWLKVLGFFANLLHVSTTRLCTLWCLSFVL